ncbi:MAG TPA: uracil-DNA glycosylase family protein [Verrucomicrobiae bacterium]|jgi:single-strand selective monofunctional uracil DNA glycosylase
MPPYPDIPVNKTAKQLILAARELAAQVDSLKFRLPVTHVYNPLDYAWDAHEKYLRQYGGGKKRIVFLGMNPGPFGMAQTGVPFGEIASVRDWLGITANIRTPELCHPKRPVTGFACLNSEVSGRRLWGLFKERFETPGNFFADHFVTNYCPLVFMGISGSNLTPDKLGKAEGKKLFHACDAHLRRVLEILEPEWLIGVGGFAAKQGMVVADGLDIQIGQILHPSPASPAANRGWPEAVTKQMVNLGIWK